MNKNKTTEASTRSLLLCAAALATLSAAGCASETAGQDEVQDSQEGQQLQASGGGKELRDPNGSYFASVTANGTGCPAGTWNTELSPDGKTFTTTFSNYETEVDRSRMVSVKDCQLNIKLHTPQGYSFAVQEFFYAGYAYLDDDVQVRQIANYYFSGSPDENSEARTELRGPYDDTYLFQDTREDGKLVWSKCGEDNALQLRTTLRLLNSNPRRNGYVNLGALDGNTKIVFKLSWRKC